MMLARYLGLLLVIVLATSGDLGAIVIGTPIPEIGDPENISSTGRTYKELPVDAELFTIQIGDVAVWYPPTVVVDLTRLSVRSLLRS